MKLYDIHGYGRFEFELGEGPTVFQTCFPRSYYKTQRDITGSFAKAKKEHLARLRMVQQEVEDEIARVEAMTVSTVPIGTDPYA